jgi:serine/threonine protein kinase
LAELAGIGGFGEVWKAHHAFLKSKPPVALKFCLDNSAAAALRNEAGVLDRVMEHGKHGGIVPLLHTYLTADPPCLEYEYVEGGDLTGLIQEMHTGRTIKPEVANRLLVRLAEIVAFAHKAEPPIVHGDLKPANVLVRRAADGKIGLRVIDFGIGGLAAARAAQETRQPTRNRPALLTEAVRGAHTPLYASPQQMARRLGERADPRDDVHALGVIWLQLLTGDLGMMSIPSDWREQVIDRGVGEGLARLLGACISPKAEKRPASAAVLVEQINAANVPMAEPAAADAPLKLMPDRPSQAVPPTASLAPPPLPPAPSRGAAQTPREPQTADVLPAPPGKPGPRLTGPRLLVTFGLIAIVLGFTLAAINGFDMAYHGQTIGVMFCILGIIAWVAASALFFISRRGETERQQRLRNLEQYLSVALLKRVTVVGLIAMIFGFAQAASDPPQWIRLKISLPLFILGSIASLPASVLWFIWRRRETERNERKTERQQRLRDLEQVQQAMSQFVSAKHRGPANADEMAPYLRDPALTRVLQGEISVVWTAGLGQDDDISNVVYAWDTKPTHNGKWLVVFLNGHTEALSDNEFQTRPKAKTGKI